MKYSTDKNKNPLHTTVKGIFKLKWTVEKREIR